MAKLSRKADVAKAIYYAHERWPALMLSLEDGRAEMDNNAAAGAARYRDRPQLCAVRDYVEFVASRRV